MPASRTASHARRLALVLVAAASIAASSASLARAQAPTATAPAEAEVRLWLPAAYARHTQVRIVERTPMPDLGACKRERYSARGRRFQINDVAVDGRGTTWFATDVGAIGIRPDDSWIHLTTIRDALAYDTVTAVAVDTLGFPWFGAELFHRYPDGEVFLTGGVTGYLYPYVLTWRNTGDVGPGGFGVINDIAVDHQNRKWVLMGLRTVLGHQHQGGVLRLSADYTTWAYFENEAGVDLSAARRAAVDDHGTVWFETATGVVLNAPDGVWTRELGPGAPDARHIYLVAMPPGGREVWAVSGQGGDHPSYELHRRDGTGAWRPEHPDGPLGEYGPANIAVDSVGNFWWASETDSGVRWADGTWASYRGGGVVDATIVSDITADATGAAWFNVWDGWVRVQCTPVVP